MRIFLILAITVALAATGCGSEESAGDSGPPLSASQYQQIERLYQAQIEAEDMLEDERPRPAVRTMSAACDRADDSDRLVAAMVENCEELFDVLGSMFAADCDDERECARIFARGADVIERTIVTARRSEPTIAEAVTDRDCRDVLMPMPEAYEALETLKRTLRAMAGALRDGDPERIAEAAAAFEESEGDLDGVPSGRELLDRFREHCSPRA